MNLHVIPRGITQSHKAVYLKLYTDTWEDVTEQIAKKIKMYYKDGQMRVPYMGENLLIEMLKQQTNAEIIFHK